MTCSASVNEEARRRLKFSANTGFCMAVRKASMAINSIFVSSVEQGLQGVLRAIFFRSSKKRSFFPPGELVRWPWWYNMLRPNEVFQSLIMGPLCWEMPLSASKSASDKMISTIRKW